MLSATGDKLSLAMPLVCLVLVLLSFSNLARSGAQAERAQAVEKACNERVLCSCEDPQ